MAIGVGATGKRISERLRVGLAKRASARGYHSLALALAEPAVRGGSPRARNLLARTLAETGRFQELDNLIYQTSREDGSDKLRLLATALEKANEADWPTRSATRLIQYAHSVTDSGTRHGIPVPYHATKLDAVEIPGLREPEDRLKSLPVDLAENSILDVGCCLGGFLFPLQPVVRWGVGVDNNPRYLNVCQKLRSLREAWNLEFYQHDITSQPLVLIPQLMPEPTVDITLLLRVMTDESLSPVLRSLATFSQSIVFEPIASHSSKAADIQTLRGLFRTVQVVETGIPEPIDGGQHTLYYATDPVSP